MDQSIKDFYLTQEIPDYEKSHDARFNHLIDDLFLKNIKNSRIGDVGSGYGPIFKRLPQDQNNTFIGFDGAEITTSFEYHKTDLSYDFFGEGFVKQNNLLDYVLCLETLEHLTNPYHCLIEIKKILKNDGILYLSVPSQLVQHNTIYPSLLYPINNFIQFLEQLAFEVQDHRFHDKSFYQEVFVLKNKTWNESKMLWPKNEQKFQNVPPHISVNL
jgi:2-polyprenyl-3-methyl-5-hydroxy-6-metoxy-1,4-benzoquinol methylase